MNFAEWRSLSEPERQSERQTWHVFEPGYWHSLAVEAAAQFAAEFGSIPHVLRVSKSLYSGDELLIAVETDLSPPELVAILPPSYLGFRVMQYNGKTPAGVLVDPGPPSATSLG